MGAVFCFLLFLAAVGLCILLGQSLILAIWVGIAASTISFSPPAG